MWQKYIFHNNIHIATSCLNNTEHNSDSLPDYLKGRPKTKICYLSLFEKKSKCYKDLEQGKFEVLKGDGAARTCQVLQDQLVWNR